jgi:membrane-associated HD superfamily phosphohydrolase
MSPMIYILIASALLGGVYLKYTFMQNEIESTKELLITQKTLTNNAQNQVLEAKTINEQNAEELEKLKKDYEEKTKFIAKKIKEDKKYLQEIQTLKERISNADKKDDAPTANILLDTIEWLRTAQSERNSNTSKNKD